MMAVKNSSVLLVLVIWCTVAAVVRTVINIVDDLRLYGLTKVYILLKTQAAAASRKYNCKPALFHPKTF